MGAAVKRNQFGVLLVLLLSAVCAFAADAKFSPDFTLPSKGDFKFVVYGDIRFTDPANVRPSNPEMRHALVSEIAKEKPQAVIITGDIVLRGDNPEDWKVFDQEATPLRDGITLWPTLGNHDLYRDPQQGLAHYFARFPELKDKRWYSARRGNVAFFLLDSASDAQGGEEWQWLDRNLSALPRNVNFVIIAMHHPPITHSTELTGHPARSSEQALGEMIEKHAASSKAKFVVLAGHVHNYERYERGGVEYIVTGGGGATPYPIPRAPEDHYREAGPTYHFCRFTVQGRKLHMDMVKVEGDPQSPSFAVKDSFDLTAEK